MRHKRPDETDEDYFLDVFGSWPRFWLRVVLTFAAIAVLLHISE